MHQFGTPTTGFGPGVHCALCFCWCTQGSECLEQEFGLVGGADAYKHVQVGCNSPPNPSLLAWACLSLNLSLTSSVWRQGCSYGWLTVTSPALLCACQTLLGMLRVIRNMGALTTMQATSDIDKAMFQYRRASTSKGGLSLLGALLCLSCSTSCASSRLCDVCELREFFLGGLNVLVMNRHRCLPAWWWLILQTVAPAPVCPPELR